MIFFFASSRGMRSIKTTGTSPYQQWCGLILVLALVSCCVGVASPFGTIVGTVTDPTGALPCPRLQSLSPIRNPRKSNHSDQWLPAIIPHLDSYEFAFSPGATDGLLAT